MRFLFQQHRERRQEKISMRHRQSVPAFPMRNRSCLCSSTHGCDTQTIALNACDINPTKTNAFTKQQTTNLCIFYPRHIDRSHIYVSSSRDQYCRLCLDSMRSICVVAYSQAHLVVLSNGCHVAESTSPHLCLRHLTHLSGTLRPHGSRQSRRSPRQPPPSFQVSFPVPIWSTTASTASAKYEASILLYHHIKNALDTERVCICSITQRKHTHHRIDQNGAEMLMTKVNEKWIC